MSNFFQSTTLSLIYMVLFLIPGTMNGQDQPDRPNILWLTTEDHGPHLGIYGDEYAHTPAMDTFAESSLRYSLAWSDAPVCAPARTAIITGVYPTSTGGQHMRSDAQLPDFMKKYPILLREAGYYTTNNSKTDYNVSGHEEVWDESSSEAHWRNREDGQPFFAIFNFMESHESRIRNRTELPHHHPDEAPVPPYHPDRTEVRRDWAQYYHGIYEADRRIQNKLEELEEAGLADETIVFIYSDHGSGMPRHKRWPNNQGLHVPLIVHVPEKYQHLAPEDYLPGGITDRPVGFVDLAPTLLSIIGMEPPEWMQGKAFMGYHEDEPREYVFGFRGRMDERYDMVRSVRKDNYIYIRNYNPHLIYGQYIAYMWITKTTQIWDEMYQAGELEPPQTYFWEPKPEVEFYDLENDPHEVKNLAGSEEHKAIIEELSGALHEHILSTRDAGFLHEGEMHRRASEHNLTIYEMAQDENIYPLEQILEFAEVAADSDLSTMDHIRNGLEDEDPAIRYWAITGILIRGEEAFAAVSDQIRLALHDENPNVQVVSAQALVDFGTDTDKDAAVEALLELVPADKENAFISIAALNILSGLLDEYGEKIKEVAGEMEVTDPDLPDRPNDYVHRFISTIMEHEK
ncbi:MAG: sulfatase-like hydrolase/transferase [Balneolaceae bacterium]|nr:sulfatase-like hydrolase/transferase [Balneolaceae bacterium]